MKRLIIFVLFFGLFLVSANNAVAVEYSSASSAVLAKSLPEDTQDYRARILEKFLAKYNSPLTSFADEFVRAADLFDLDWKLVAAISGVESTFGHQIPSGSYNAWGWGIYGNNVTYFSSWSEGIQTVTRELRRTYIDRWGADNIYQIGARYAASPAWAVHVVYYMNAISEFGLENPQDTIPLTL